MTRKQSTELAVIDVDRYAVALDKTALADYLAENLAPGERIGLGDLPVIKIPGAGGQNWELPSGEAVKTLDCIIVHREPVRAYWEQAFSGEGAPPDCSSLDPFTGVGHGMYEGQPCVTCPQAQRGSKPGDSNAQACRLITRLYLLFSGSLFPTVLRLPPSSYRSCMNYPQQLRELGYPSYYKVGTRIGLAQKRSQAGILYSVATFTPHGILSAAAMPALLAYREALLGMVSATQVTAEEAV